MYLNSDPLLIFFQDFGIDKNLSERIADIENDPALRGSLEKVRCIFLNSFNFHDICSLSLKFGNVGVG